jgi:hypothetical protein
MILVTIVPGARTTGHNRILVNLHTPGVTNVNVVQQVKVIDYD